MAQAQLPVLAQVPFAEWPRLLRELAPILSTEALWRLVERYGGTQLAVPVGFDPDGKLATEIGQVDARALVNNCGGLKIDVPRACKVLRWLRDETVTSELRGGLSIKEVARRHQLTRRQVTNIRKHRRNITEAARNALLSAQDAEPMLKDAQPTCQREKRP